MRRLLLSEKIDGATPCEMAALGQCCEAVAYIASGALTHAPGMQTRLAAIACDPPHLALATCSSPWQLSRFCSTLAYAALF